MCVQFHSSWIWGVISMFDVTQAATTDPRHRLYLRPCTWRTVGREREREREEKGAREQRPYTVKRKMFMMRANVLNTVARNSDVAQQHRTRIVLRIRREIERDRYTREKRAGTSRAYSATSRRWKTLFHSWASRTDKFVYPGTGSFLKHTRCNLYYPPIFSQSDPRET